MLLARDIQLPVGGNVVDIPVRVICAEQYPLGTIVEFDFGRDDPRTDSLVPGLSTSLLVRVTAPTAVGTKWGRIHAVLTEECYPEEPAWAKVGGRVLLIVGGAATAGQAIVVGDDPTVNGKRVKGLIDEAGGVDGEIGYLWAVWSGLYGFGTPFVGGASEPPGGGRPPVVGFGTDNPGIFGSSTSFPPSGLGGLVEH